MNDSFLHDYIPGCCQHWESLLPILYFHAFWIALAFGVRRLRRFLRSDGDGDGASTERLQGDDWQRLKRRIRLGRSSSFWSVPLFYWALRTIRMWEVELHTIGLVALPVSYYLDFMRTAFLVLMIVTVIQEIVCRVLDRDLPFLGLAPATRAACLCSVLTVAMNFFGWASI